jgi:2-iminobutanoate/2-iminopropanoate deaminase
VKKVVGIQQIPLLGQPMSPATVGGDFVYTSGMYGVDPITLLAPEGFEAQATLAIRNLIAVSAVAGMSSDHFVRCRVFLKDMQYLPAFNRIFTALIGANLPAVSVIALPNFIGPYLIQIEAMGIKDISSLKKEVLYVPEIYTPPVFPYPQGMKVGKFIFTSAQYPFYPNGKPEEKFEDQIRLTINNMLAIVKAGGGDKASIMKNLNFLCDMKRFDDFNVVYSEFFQKENHPPARSCYGPKELYGMSRYGLECVAYLGDWNILKSPSSPVLPMPFCQGTEAEGLVYVSGQVGFNPKINGWEDNFEVQTRQMMNNMLNVAKEAGAGPIDFLKCSNFLTAPGQLDFYNELYKEYFQDKENYPALATYQVVLAYTYLIEIDGIAYVGPKK